MASCVLVATVLGGVAMGAAGGGAPTDQIKWFVCGGNCVNFPRKQCDVMACCCTDTSTTPHTVTCGCMDSDCDNQSHCTAGGQVE